MILYDIGGININKKTIVISDVDGVLRQNKKPISVPLFEKIKEISSNGTEFIAISGAPLEHLEDLSTLSSARIFAEMGGVELVRNNGSNFREILASNSHHIDFLKKALGFRVEKGIDKIDKIEVIVEGPRFTSLSIITGSPPHYNYEVPTSFAIRTKLLQKIEDLIRHYGLNLTVMPGEDNLYQWIDVVSITKTQMVEKIVKNKTNIKKIYYLGDGASDLGPMKLSQIIPVALKNSIEEIKKIAWEKGVYINEEGDKGALEFLKSYI